MRRSCCVATAQSEGEVSDSTANNSHWSRLTELSRVYWNYYPRYGGLLRDRLRTALRLRGMPKAFFLGSDKNGLPLWLPHSCCAVAREKQVAISLELVFCGSAINEHVEILVNNLLLSRSGRNPLRVRVSLFVLCFNDSVKNKFYTTLLCSILAAVG